MYQKFYNLTKEPFHITPDPQFLYLSESHKQALASMIYGIEKRKGFVAITGGVGVGKTTIVRAYLDKAAATNLKVIYVFHANVTFKELVKVIYREFGLELATNHLVEMVNGLHLALIELYRQGKTVVIIIDEAQNMPIETLESLRMLSNLETPTEKLIQVVLVGQTELDELLEKHELRQLKQRIAIRARIASLSAQDSRAYIEYRLSVAGLDNSSIFDQRALDIIIREANGVPRKLNILCDNALITGFGYQKNPVTARIAREVVSDFASPGKRRPLARRWRAAALVVVGVILALLIAFFLSPYGNSLKGALGIASVSDTRKPEPARALVNRDPGEKEPVPPVNAVAPGKQETDVNQGAAAEAKGKVKTKYRTRVVKEGETLSDLVRQVYGLSPKGALNASLLELVKQHNPTITDSNLIIAGSVIQFPDLPRDQRQDVVSSP
jgi:general secretion pathway protein A